MQRDRAGSGKSKTDENSVLLPIGEDGKIQFEYGGCGISERRGNDVCAVR